MELTIRELIDQLEEQAEDLGDEARVRIACQPEWPLRGTVANVISDTDLVRLEAEEDERNPTDDELEAELNAQRQGEAPIVWLAVDSAPYMENRYASKMAWSTV